MEKLAFRAAGYAAFAFAFISRALRAWPGLALAFAALTLGAQAQTVPVTGNLDVKTYGGKALTIAIALKTGVSAPGTVFDVNYTVTNVTAYPLRFVENSSTGDVSLQPAGLTLIEPASQALPAAVKDVVLQPGGFFTLSFQVAVSSASGVSNALAQISYSVGRVYDQIWNYDDFDNFCGALPAAVIHAATPALMGVQSGAIPGCVYRQEGAIHNDLTYPVTVSFSGYDDSGAIAPYIGGALCDPVYCGNEWIDAITLQPGESSAPFTMLVGMPWFIGDEARGATGTYTFTWRLTPVGDPPAVTDVSVIAPVPALGETALALLALSMSGLGARRAKRGRI